MSTSTDTQSESHSHSDGNGRAEYRMRESDWFAARDYPGHGDQDDDRDGDGSHHRDYGATSKADWLAHQLLRRTGRLLCATTLFGTPDRGLEPLFAWLYDDDLVDHDPLAMHHENGEVELTDPIVRLGRVGGEEFGTTEYTSERYQKRVNPEHGYISGGESTGVIIGDRPTAAFLEVVDIYLDVKDIEWGRAAELRELAEREKEAGERRDVDILSRVIAAAEHTPN